MLNKKSMLHLTACVMTVFIGQEMYSSGQAGASSASSSSPEYLVYRDQLKKLGSTKVLNDTKKSISMVLLLGQCTSDTTMRHESLKPGEERSLSHLLCFHGKIKSHGGDDELRLEIGSPFQLTLGVPKNIQRIKLLVGRQILFDDATKEKDNAAASTSNKTAEQD